MPIDYSEKLRQQAEALDFYDQGTPSALPDSNRFKSRVEAHRWGGHGDRPMPDTCPVCARAKAAESKARPATPREYGFGDEDRVFGHGP